jgi:DNA-directed RNA polymerase subunit K/omega
LKALTCRKRALEMNRESPSAVRDEERETKTAASR